MNKNLTKFVKIFLCASMFIAGMGNASVHAQTGEPPNEAVDRDPRPLFSESESRELSNLAQSLQQNPQTARENFEKLDQKTQRNLLKSLEMSRVETQMISREVSLDEMSKISGGQISGMNKDEKSGILAASTFCRQATWSSTSYSLVGIKLWSYFQSIYWCYNGSTITYLSRNRWGETYAAFWEFTGNNGNSTMGGTGYNGYYAWTQGSFRLCTGIYGVGCLQYSYPTIASWVYANGSYK